MQTELREFSSFTKMLAAGSGKIIRSYYRHPFSIETKPDDSPVTIADKKAEEFIRECIHREYPGHGIIGEEFGSENTGAEYTWVIDPIDGTKSFVCGVPLFGTLIALNKNNDTILGCFHQPVLGELLLGDNLSTELNGAPVRVRNCQRLSDAVLLTTDEKNIERYQDIRRYRELCEKVKFVRTWGDCYGYYLLATGFADIMIDAIMSVWDSCALVPIIKGAGGIIGGYAGGDTIKENSTVAASPAIYEEVMRILNPAG